MTRSKERQAAKLEVNRRSAMGAAAGLALAPTAALAAPAITTKRKTYVLVHGTWHGGWAWDSVAAWLRSAGHRVIAPTMTGCGERFHLIQPDTNLSTHIDDVCHAIEWEELEDVILVSHSFAGITITGVADRLQDRVSHLVYYDSLIPTAARPAAIMPDPETGAYPQWWQDRAAVFRDGYKMIFWDHYPPEMLVPVEDEANIAKLRRRITWHPAGQWTEPLDLQNDGWEAFPRTCIEAAGQVYRPSSEAMIGPGRGAGWDFVSLDIARAGYLTDPKLLAECFMTLG